MKNKELDALVAEKIFGHEVVLNITKRHEFYTIGEACWYDDEGCMELANSVPLYSQDISAAWEVVEKMEGVWDIKSFSKGWYVRLAVRTSPFSDKIVDADAPTLPEAICLAALRTINE